VQDLAHLFFLNDAMSRPILSHFQIIASNQEDRGCKILLEPYHTRILHGRSLKNLAKLFKYHTYHFAKPVQDLKCLQGYSSIWNPNHVGFCMTIHFKLYKIMLPNLYNRIYQIHACFKK